MVPYKNMPIVLKQVIYLATHALSDALRVCYQTLKKKEQLYFVLLGNLSVVTTLTETTM